MAYTPPAGDAAHFTWLDAAAYTAPAGDAAHLAFAPDVPQATMLGVGLLGAPRLRANPRPLATLLGPGLLGAPGLAANPRTVGWLTGTGILGVPVLMAAATGTQAHLQGPGLLGAPATTAWAGYRAWLAAPGLLGAPRLRANPRSLATLLGPGLLGAPRQTAFIYPPAAAVLPAGVTTYHCRLTGAPDGMADVTLPMSSFSVRHRYDGPSYYQLTIPTYAYVSAIAARPNGEIVIWSKTGEVEEELLRGDLGNVRTDRGPKSQSISISGNSERAASDPATYLLAEALYASTTFEGESRLRIPPRAAIRPGDFIRYADLNFQAGEVTWSVAVSAGGMAITMEIASLPVDA